jgi:uncharacterized membrane protein (UPF0127 family)
MPHFLRPLLVSREPHVLRQTRTGAVIASALETAFDGAARRRGLLGRRRLPDGAALVIAPCSAIHTIGMRFPIDVVFAARDGRVVKVRPGVAPWRLAISPFAFAVVELPAGALSRSGLQAGDRVEVVPM